MMLTELILVCLCAVGLSFSSRLPLIKSSHAVLGLAFLLGLIIAATGIKIESLDLGRRVFELNSVASLIITAILWALPIFAILPFQKRPHLVLGSLSMIAIGLSVFGLISGAFLLAVGAALAGIIAGLSLLKLEHVLSLKMVQIGLAAFLGGLSLLGIAYSNGSIWLLPSLFIAFLADIIFTALWRLRARQPVFTPHDQHLFQIIIRAGVKPYVAAWIYVWITLHGLLIAGLSLAFPRGGTLLGFMALLLILFLIDRRVRMAAERNGFL